MSDRKGKYTCPGCCKVLERKPYMGGLRWQTMLIRFLSKHYKCRMKVAPEAK